MGLSSMGSGQGVSKLRFHTHVVLFVWIASITSLSAWGQSLIAVDRSQTHPVGFSLGMESQFWDYQETVDGARFMRDRGMLYGVRGTGELQLWGLLVLQARGRFLIGSTTYEGGTVNLDTGEKRPLTASSSNSILEFGPLLGVRAPISDSISVMPTAGVNFRRLSNPEQANRSSDYDRVATYLTLPVGLDVSLRLSDSFNFSLGGEYHLLRSANTTSTFPKGGLATEEVVVRSPQKKGYGYSTYLRFGFKSDSETEFALIPYYRVWDFEDSEPERIRFTNAPDLVLVEPKNRTQSIGINFALNFSLN